jgi:hypothetical protein
LSGSILSSISPKCSKEVFCELPLYGVLTAGCIDTDPPASRRTFGQSQKSITGIEYAHHAMWVTFTETRCKKFAKGSSGIHRRLPAYGLRFRESHFGCGRKA